ncbi:MAG: 30S ribosomal protein S17e [Candidatus Aenigmarchaeota archaeon]|nr:30S ribosomal protein S17e [Candidatus Aenigmarchaeota archaeon]
MGRIKTADIKRASWELMERYPGKFTESFEENKKILKEMDMVEEKKTRNKIAGHLIRAVKQTA